MKRDHINPLLANKASQLARLKVFDFLLSAKRYLYIDDPFNLISFDIVNLLRTFDCAVSDQLYPLSGGEFGKISQSLDFAHRHILFTDGSVNNLKDRVVFLFRPKRGLIVDDVEGVARSVNEFAVGIGIMPPNAKIIFIRTPEVSEEIWGKLPPAPRIKLDGSEVDRPSAFFAELVDLEVQWREGALRLGGNNSVPQASLAPEEGEVLADVILAQGKITAELVEALRISNASHYVVLEFERYSEAVRQEIGSASEIDSRARLLLEISSGEFDDWNAIAKAKFGEFKRLHARICFLHPALKRINELVRAGVTGLSVSNQVVAEFEEILAEGHKQGVVDKDLVDVVGRENRGSRTDVSGGVLIRGMAERIDAVLRNLPAYEKGLEAVVNLSSKFHDFIQFVRGFGLF